MSNPNPEVNGEGQQQTAARAPTREALSAPCTALHRIDSFDAAELIFFTCKSSPCFFFTPFLLTWSFSTWHQKERTESRRAADPPQGHLGSFHGLCCHLVIHLWNCSCLVLRGQHSACAQKRKWLLKVLTALRN